MATRYGEVLEGDLFGKASDYAAVHIATNYAVLGRVDEFSAHAF